MSLTWPSPQAPWPTSVETFQGSPNLLRHSPVSNPHNSWITSNSQSPNAPTYSPPVQLSNNDSYIRQPTLNTATYHQQIQTSPMSPSFGESLPTPSDLQHWPEHNLEELRQHAHWRTSLEASQGSTNASRVHRETRLRHPAKPFAENESQRQRLESVDPVYNRQASFQAPHSYTGWPQGQDAHIEGLQPDGGDAWAMF
jgi:hypothetical protein